MSTFYRFSLRDINTEEWIVIQDFDNRNSSIEMSNAFSSAGYENRIEKVTTEEIFYSGDPLEPMEFKSFDALARYAAQVHCVEVNPDGGAADMHLYDDDREIEVSFCWHQINNGKWILNTGFLSQEDIDLL